jgi:hypothetical protein
MKTTNTIVLIGVLVRGVLSTPSASLGTQYFILSLFMYFHFLENCISWLHGRPLEEALGLVGNTNRD